MTENYERVRVPVEDRIRPGDPAGLCTFPMDGGPGKPPHLCVEQVITKSVNGALPKYCGKVINGVLHDGKKAAIARDRLGISTQDVKQLVKLRAQAAEPAPGGEVIPIKPVIRTDPAPTPVPPPALPQIPRNEQPSRNTAPTKVSQNAPVAARSGDRAATYQPDPHPAVVTELREQFQALVAKFDSAARLVAHAAEVVAPEARAVVEAAAAAGAAEREIIEVTARADEKIAAATTARQIAEERAVQHADARREMAEERDTALAESAKAKREADEYRQQAETAAEEAAAARSEAAEQVAEAKRQAAERVSQIQSETGKQVTEAQRNQARAEQAAAELRIQVEQLTAQLETERLERREDTKRHNAREDEHREEINALHLRYQDMLKSAYEITDNRQRQRRPKGGDQVAPDRTASE